MIRSKSDKSFELINITILIILTLIVTYPLYFVVIASISSPEAVNLGKVLLLPRDINLTGYSFILKENQLWNGYLVTIVLTLVGTVINLAFTLAGAYSLTKTFLPGIKVIMFLFTFTMFFSGGLIPTYILVSKLKLRNTLWAMILPSAVSVYNLILVRTYFMKNIPAEIIDASKIDGCSDFTLFLRIVLPLSSPIIATMALFYGVGHWNQFFAALIYINDKNLFPLQLVLRNLLLTGNTAMTNMINSGTLTAENAEYISQLMQRAEILKYAIIIVSTVPVLVVYPFLQKYFIKGIMAGSLKG